MKVSLIFISIFFSFQLLYAQTPGTKKWEFDFGGDIGFSPAIGLDETIYVGAGYKLYAINPNGTKKWDYEKGYSVSSPSIGSTGIIYFTSKYSGDACEYLFLGAINPNGTTKWTFETSCSLTGAISSPAISTNATVYVGQSDRDFAQLIAVGPDGLINWTCRVNGSTPIIGYNGIVYASSGIGLCAINADSTKKWEFQESRGGLNSKSIGADGTIYAGSLDSSIYAINDEGAKVWEFQTNGRVYSSPAIGSDGIIYVGSDDSILYAINPNGTKEWGFKTDNIVRSSPAIGSTGTIYIGSNDSSFYAINPDGTKKWEFQTSGCIESSPAIGEAGTVYVSSNDGKLYALNCESEGLADSPWPKFQHDNQNSGNYYHVTSIDGQNIIELPNEFILYPLYPNPFNPLIQIRFTLPRAENVEISVYNIKGQFISNLLNTKKNTGTYLINWDALDIASGMYLIRMKAGNYIQSRKCLLLK